MRLDAHITNGGSGPQVFDFDDRVIRLVKWHPSSHGIAATYAELAASRLAQLVGAPTLRGSVVYVDPALAPDWQPVEHSLHVGFPFLHGRNLHEGGAQNLENEASFPAAAAFLAWLLVGDQDGHNQYVWQAVQVLPDGTSRPKNEMFLVDLSKCFGGWDWPTAGLPAVNAPYVVPSVIGAGVGVDDCQVALGRIKALDKDSIRACFDAYPDSWGLPAGTAHLAADFLVERRDHLEAVLQAGLPAVP